MPVNSGRSAPNTASRTRDCTPSAPMTSGAVAASPRSNAMVTESPFCVTPMHLRSRWIASGRSRRIASSSTACRSPRWNIM